MDIAASRKALVGKAQTVLGPVDAGDLGVTMTHEHLLAYLPHVAKEPTEASKRATFHAPVTLEVLGRIRYGREVNRENCQLLDAGTAIEEVSLYRQAGGRTLVDATSIGIGRDPAGLARIARATGLNIVMGASYYIEEDYPPECRVEAKGEEELADDILRDLFEGADGTGVRAGLIGEVGCSWPLTANERKVLRASAKAQALSGAPLMIHPGRHPEAPGEIVEVLRGAGADLSRTVMCHIDRTIDDQATLKELAQSGCVLEYDLFGTEHSHSPWFLKMQVDMPNDAGRLRSLAWLIAEGLGDQIVISQDICYKHQLVRYGGHGYAHILANVVPWMRRRGFEEADIGRILLETPKRLLAFA